MKIWIASYWKLLLIIITSLISVGYISILVLDRLRGNVTFTIHGQVLDSANGQPLPGARVKFVLSKRTQLLPSLRGGIANEDLIAISGADGRFCFNDVHGQYAYYRSAELEEWTTEGAMKIADRTFYPDNGYNPSWNRPPNYAKPFQVFMQPVMKPQGKKSH